MAILASDTFNRANENPLAGTWAAVAGANQFKLASNSVTPITLGSDTEQYDTSATWPNDQFSRAKLTVTGTGGAGQGIGLVVRQSTSLRTFYRLVVDHAAASNVDVGRFASGAYTSIQRFTQAWTDGDTWEFQAQGSTLRVFLNGVQVGTDITDATIAGGSAGIGYSSSETAATIDDWEGGDIGVPGGWSLYRPYTLGADITGGVVSGLFYYWRRRKQEKPDE